MADTSRVTAENIDLSDIIMPIKVSYWTKIYIPEVHNTWLLLDTNTA